MLKRCTFTLIVLAVFSIQFVHAQKYIISTVAGNGNGHGSFGSFSGDGGPATLAGLNGPSEVAVDDTGNIYICDETNSRVRKVDINGIITTYAGRGDSGWILNDGHPATDASLSEPWGVAWYPKKGLYISDWNNRRIRLVDKLGIIHTVAGNGKYGYTGDGGPADSATMSNPYGLIVDHRGNLYFTDAFNNVIRKVDTNGIITTFAGNSIKGYSGDGGQATDAELNTPVGVAADTFGNVYIDDFQVIRKVDTAGIITTIIGNGTAGHSGDGGLATNAEIGSPFDCALDDSGNIYLAEYFYNYVRKVYTNDTIISIAGDDVQGYNNYEGNPDTAKMWFPLGLTADHSGNIFFANETDQLVQELSPCSAPVTALPLNPHICRGVSIALTAKGFNTYSWSPGSSLKDSTGYTVIASPSVTTTYTITGTTCKGSDTIVVTVDTTTKAPNLKITPGTTTLCNGQSVTLNATGSPSTYTWSPMWSLSSSTGSSVVATPTMNTTYVVMEPTCSATDTAIVNVNPVPGIYVYPATTTEFCQGQTITLYYGGANGFKWTPMTGLDTTAFDSLNANPTVTTTYVVVGSSLGCTSIPDTFVLTVNPTPVVTINPSSPGFCTAGSVTIIAGGAATYQWSPFAAISDTVGDTIVANPSITTTYTITGTSVSGCISATDTFTVSVDTMPIITINPPSATFCQGSGITLIAGGGPTYDWSPSTGLSATTGSSVIANPAVTTTYTIISGANSCADTVQYVVNVIPSPNQPSFTQHNDTLISSSKNDNQWYRNDTLLKNDTSQYLIITTLGNYWVVVTNEVNGCGTASDSMNVSSLTGIRQLIVESEQLTIYPNPTSNQLTVESGQMTVNEISITNLLGQTILKVPFRGFRGDIDVSSLPDGLYFIALTTDTETITHKFVKERQEQ